METFVYIVKKKLGEILHFVYILALPINMYQVVELGLLLMYCDLPCYNI